MKVSMMLSIAVTIKKAETGRYFCCSCCCFLLSSLPSSHGTVISILRRHPMHPIYLLSIPKREKYKINIAYPKWHLVLIHTPFFQKKTHHLKQTARLQQTARVHNPSPSPTSQTPHYYMSRTTFPISPRTLTSHIPYLEAVNVQYPRRDLNVEHGEHRSGGLAGELSVQPRVQSGPVVALDNGTEGRTEERVRLGVL